MSKLRIALDEYLKVRRALGYKLLPTAGLLQRFVDFADRAGADFITTELALKWAMQPAQGQPRTWAKRLGMVRQLARHCRAIDPRTIIPPPDLIPYQYQRPAPYIYRDDQITRLLQAAQRLQSATGLRSLTYATLFGLYAVTGMRHNEAVQLDREDVDLVNGVVTIRCAKFGKSRYVPLHSTAKRALQRYAAHRDRLCCNPLSPSFFLSERGARLRQVAVGRTFVKLCCEIGIRRPGDSRGPRLHDLRHRLAINTLLNWYRDGVDVEQHLPELSTYLGHTQITDTYWYLTSTPELLRYALRRVERCSRGPRP
jgi:integrase/recombinase XerD